eukprot:jgi/Ulvmu1/1911/UM012_0070.1
MQRELSATHSAVASQLSQISSGAWTSSGIVDDLTPQLVEAVSATFKDLDPLIRVRFLVACCLAPPDKKPALMPGLRNVIQLAQKDEDEWVQALGHSIDPEHASIRLDEESLQRGRSEVSDSVKELIEALDSVTVNNCDQLCPTVDTFICKSQQASLKSPAEHTHFTVRDSYHDIEAILLEGRPGDACLPSIISRASEGSGYAALFSGQHTVTAAPQFRQNKVASASMFAKSTASHPKPHAAGQRHSSGAAHGSSQHPNKRTKLTASVPGHLPAATADKAPSAGRSSPLELQARTSCPAAVRPDAAPSSGPFSAATPTATVGAATAAVPPVNGASPSGEGLGYLHSSGYLQHGTPGGLPMAGMPKQQGGSALPLATNARGGTGCNGGAGGDAGLCRAADAVFPQPNAAEEDGGATAAVPGGGDTAAEAAAARCETAAQQALTLPEIGSSLLHASVASSDLPAVHLERAGSSRHGDG